jgi:flavodoxin
MSLKTLVLYASLSGNTEKVAKEITSELDCEIYKLEEGSDYANLNLSNFDLVILGTGNYTGKPNSVLTDFLHKMDIKGRKKFALFVTWIGREPSDRCVYEEVKNLVELKGQIMVDGFFECLGQGSPSVPRWIYLLMGQGALGHPNAEELVSARIWARELKIEISPTLK